MKEENNIKIRKAEFSDIDFIAEAIIESEKSGTSVFSYSEIYEMSEDDFKDILLKMIVEDIEGQEIGISGFLIAEYENEKAGCCCSWIEGETGMTAAMIKSNLMLAFIPEENIIKAASKSSLIREIFVERTKNAIQIEAVYTVSKFRGKGIASLLIDEHIKRQKNKRNDLTIAELIVAGNNSKAINLYEKKGFDTAVYKKCNNMEILNYLPSDTIILMRKKI